MLASFCFTALFTQLSFGLMIQDQDIACVAVVDLYGGSLTVPAPVGRSAAAAAAGAKPGLFPPPQRCKLCTLHFVDPQMFRSRPGLVVHQVGSGSIIFHHAQLLPCPFPL